MLEWWLGKDRTWLWLRVKAGTEVLTLPEGRRVDVWVKTGWMRVWVRFKVACKAAADRLCSRTQGKGIWV